MKQKPVDQKVEDALNSLDGIQRATAQPWFLSRVNARLQKDENTSWASIGSFLSRPVVALAGVSIILLLNMFLLVSNKSEGTAGALSGQFEPLLTSDNESVIVSINSFDYENLVQP